MNRPTDELENLLSMADEAMADGDFESAVGILREATSIAPLRRDVRNKLALALERAPAGSHGNHASTRSHHAPEPSPVEEPQHAPEPQELPSFSTASVAFEDFDDDDGEVDEDYLPSVTVPVASGPGGVEQISDVARKAFKVAAGTTSRAGVATRNLTNLLQTGIQSWKSSLVDQVQAARASENAVRQDQGAAAVAGASPEAGLFKADKDLDAYLNQPLSATVSSFQRHHAEETEADPAPETDKVTRSAPVSRKASRAGSTKKSTSRPNDVEDVLAAGIGGLIEVVARTDKKKFVYAGVYMLMGGLFAFACFDSTRKFPGVQAVPAVRSVEAASMNALDFSVSSGNVIEEARQLAQMGKPTQAINLLKNGLVTGQHSSADKIRIELAAQLNTLAEAKLRNNQLTESADLYRNAVIVLPNDQALSLRLANALYYQGVMGKTSADEREAALKEGLEIVQGLASKGSDNVQVYRVLALLHEATGSKNQAKASWQKVKAMAPENSAEQKEAASHLK